MSSLINLRSRKTMINLCLPFFITSYLWKDRSFDIDMSVCASFFNFPLCNVGTRRSTRRHTSIDIDWLEFARLGTKRSVLLSPRIAVHSYLHFTPLIGVCRLSSLPTASEGDREREKDTRRRRRCNGWWSRRKRREREKKKMATLEGTICTTRDNHPMLLTAGLTGAATDDDDEFRGKTYRSLACAVRCLQVDTHGQRCESRRSVVQK